MAALSTAFAVAVYFGSRHMAKLNEAEASASNKVSGQLSDSVSNILAVKTSAAQQREMAHFSGKVLDWRSGNTRNHAKLPKSQHRLLVNHRHHTNRRIGICSLRLWPRIYLGSAIYLIVTYTSTVAHNLWNMNGIMRTYNRVMVTPRK